MLILFQESKRDENNESGSSDAGDAFIVRVAAAACGL